MYNNNIYNICVYLYIDIYWHIHHYTSAVYIRIPHLTMSQIFEQSSGLKPPCLLTLFAPESAVERRGRILFSLQQKFETLHEFIKYSSQKNILCPEFCDRMRTLELLIPVWLRCLAFWSWNARSRNSQPAVLPCRSWTTGVVGWYSMGSWIHMEHLQCSTFYPAYIHPT